MFAQLLYPNLVAKAPPFAVNATFAGDQRSPALAGFDDDEWLVAFEGVTGRWTRRFDATGHGIPGTPERPVSVSETEQTDLRLSVDGTNALAVWAEGGRSTDVRCPGRPAKTRHRDRLWRPRS